MAFFSRQRALGRIHGALPKTRGLTVTIQKLTPYINVDPGKFMNPYQHGECSRHRRRRGNGPDPGYANATSTPPSHI